MASRGNKAIWSFYLGRLPAKLSTLAGKVEWNLTTPDTLDDYIRHVLPQCRNYLKPDIYRPLTMTLCAVASMSIILSNPGNSKRALPESRRLPELLGLIKPLAPQSAKQLLKLILLLSDLVEDDDIDVEYREGYQPLQLSSGDQIGAITCIFCNGDIFDRYWRCEICEGLPSFCHQCVSLGRRCCEPDHNLRPVQRCSRKDLERVTSLAKEVYHNLAGDQCIINPTRPIHHQVNRTSATTAWIVNSCGANVDDINGRSCHGCRLSIPSQVGYRRIECSLSQCPKVFCDRCIWRRHGDRFGDLAKLSSWTCYCCTEKCFCRLCLGEGYEYKVAVRFPDFHMVVERNPNYTGGKRCAVAEHDTILIPPGFSSKSSQVEVVCVPGKNNPFNDWKATLRTISKSTTEVHSKVNRKRKRSDSDADFGAEARLVHDVAVGVW
ncbi:hypothetical protein M427DRAFT_290295 [Gonapodya prolifera JEL478]|uniref:Zinc-finger domain-containing protein n=1 Tax=Gonapodya prolifera (strain JEL478) TaxID=1344416 RepID=A0A139AHV1_GONPJ|nr:hypothetical protein M427DRAFT_290295 [Gonapodya prolifera JEL478]|eukprot:KXS16402.1 hypothetical protein M427DRAFT_290295 [Gonapodya prolifera JEL478]